MTAGGERRGGAAAAGGAARAAEPLRGNRAGGSAGQPPHPSGTGTRERSGPGIRGMLRCQPRCDPAHLQPPGYQDPRLCGKRGEVAFKGPFQPKLYGFDGSLRSV